MSKHFYLLDPGHGKETPGKRSPEWPDMPQLFEWEFNRDVARRLLKLLLQADIDANLLVSEDVDVPLGERARRANQLHDSKRNVVVVSIHGNAMGDGSAHHPARGFEVFTAPGQTESDKLANRLFVAARETVDRWSFRADSADGDLDKEADFYILRATHCPAVLTENGFMTNREDCARMLTPEFRDLVALYHFKGIKAYEQG